MKKCILSIFLILICYFGYGQYPIQQNLGSGTTLVKNPNYGGLQGGLIPYTFADTTAANTALTYLKTYNGALVYTTSDSALYFRCCGATKWQQILPSGGSSGLRAWLIGGQGGLFTSPVDPQIIGVTTNQPFGFMTNNVNRVIVPAAGLSLLTLQSDTTLNKPMTYNTSTKEWNYGYWFGGGSGATPTWQQTLTAGSTLTGTNTIDVNGTDLFFYNAQTIEMQVVGTETNVIALNGASSEIRTSNVVSNRESNINIYTDSIHIEPSLGNIYIDTLQNAVGTHALRYNPTTGLVSYADTTTGGGSVAISSLTAATGTNTINNVDYLQEWQWNSLNAGGLKLSSSSTEGASHSKLLHLSATGTAAGAQEASLLYLESAKVLANGVNHGIESRITGASFDNEAGYFSASGGTNSNVSIWAARGSVNLGTVGTESGRLNINGSTSGTLGLTTTVTADALTSDANNTDALGSASLAWSDLYLGEGGVINWDNGDVTMTQSGNNLTVAGGAFIVTNAEQTPASFTSTFAGNMQVNWNSTTGNNVNFVFQDAGTARWYIGNNSATGSDRLHILNSSAAEAVTVLQGLQVGINKTAPTARLHVGASATTANYGSIKIDEGSRQTVAEDGTINYVSNNLEFTEGSTVYTLAKTLTNTATLDFGNTAAGVAADLTVTVTGAAVGDAVYIGAANASMSADNITFWGWVSASNTVTVRFNNNNLVSAVDPASGTFRVVVTKY